MKHTYFITQAYIDNGILKQAVVYARVVGDSKEYVLVFDTYDLAESWIADERKNGSRQMYKINKMYVADIIR